MNKPVHERVLDRMGINFPSRGGNNKMERLLRELAEEVLKKDRRLSALVVRSVSEATAEVHLALMKNPHKAPAIDPELPGNVYMIGSSERKKMQEDGRQPTIISEAEAIRLVAFGDDISGRWRLKQ